MTGRAELIAFYELSQAKAAYCRTLDTRHSELERLVGVDDPGGRVRHE